MNVNWNLFWLHASQFERYGLETGFRLFSPPHLAWLFASALCSFFIIRLYKKGDVHRRRNLQKLISVTLILSDFLKISFYAMVGAPATEYIPLAFCSFANYFILLDVMWPSKDIKKVLALAFLPTAALAILFPTTSKYFPLSFYTIHQFVFHTGIIIYPLMSYFAGELSFQYRDTWKPFLVMVLPTALVYLANRSFGHNHMYLIRTEGNPLLELIWRLSKGGIFYTLALLFLSAAVPHVMYCLFRLLEALKKRLPGTVP